MFIPKCKCFSMPEPRPATFAHCLWELLVVGLITELTFEKGVPMFILGAWFAVILLTLLACRLGTLKQLRSILILNAMLALILLSMLFFSDVVVYSYIGSELFVPPRIGIAHIAIIQSVEFFYFEMCILGSQAIYAACLANVTHKEIQERLRMGISKWI